MKKIIKLFYYIRNPKKFIQNRQLKRLYRMRFTMNDKEYISKYYKIKFGKLPNLENPLSFNEKLQWLKLNYRKPQFTTMVDKHKVKKYIANLIDEKHIVKEYGYYKTFESIDFCSLPNSFVVKTTHDSGCVCVVKDKTKVNLNEIKNKIANSLKNNYYYYCREWPYKDVEPGIIVEEFLDSNESVLPVYKFFCFNGEPYIIQYIQNDKTIYETVDYYNLYWEKLNIKQNFPNSKEKKAAPPNLNEMIQLSRILAKNLPFVRVDFFVSNSRVYFSEFTFYTDAGFEPFVPDKWDILLGNMIQLPKEKEL